MTEEEFSALIKKALLRGVKKAEFKAIMDHISMNHKKNKKMYK